MDRFYKIKDNKVTLTYLSSAILVIIASAVITLTVIYMAPESFIVFLRLIKENPLLFLLNIIPVIITALLLWAAINKTLLSLIITASIFIGFAIANNIKISMRQSPLLPTDLALLTETFAIIKNFGSGTILSTIVKIIIVVILCRLLLKFVKAEKLSAKARIIMALASAAAAFVLNITVYASNAIYDSFPVNGNIYFDVNQYGSKGFIYCFFHNANTLRVKKPDGYIGYDFPDEQYYKYSEQNCKQRPNIIMIMGEAFSDLSENPNISFDGYDDPLKNYKALCAEEGSVSGHIVVPNYGGGTSDTEFDVLTGYPTRYLESTLASYSFVNKKTDSLAWIFKNMGYDTLAIHPGYSWFYNRINVYKHLGFDDFLHLDDFDPQTQNKGGYISDEAFTDKLIEKFDESRSSGNPIFMFCVTIQNHGPYDEKYNEKYDNFSTNVSLTNSEITLLNNYFEGIKDMDTELKRLTDYLDTIDEPTVVVYFGDHLPGFSNGMDFFSILDYNINANGNAEERLGVYETPFLIWQNKAAEENGVIVTEDVDMPENMIISSNYLGALLLEYLGYGDVTDYIAYVNDLRKLLPIAANNSFMDINGIYYDFLDEKMQEKVSYLKSYAYHEVFDK